jgi:hypothetical protein
MRPLAQRSARIGTKLAGALGTPGLTMDSFQSELADWVRQEQADYVDAQRLVVPGPLQSAHAEALATFQLRYSSLATIASHLTLAQSKHDTAANAGAALASDTQLLSASDTVWEQLYKLAATQVLKAQNVTNVIVPSSRIVKNPDILSAPQLATFYRRLRTPTSGHNVKGVHGSDLVETIAVESGVSHPLSKTTPTTLSVGPNLVVNVVFKDSGGYPEVRIPVTLTIKAGGKSVYTQRHTVAQIAAGAQVTVPFTNLQPPSQAFGGNAVISVNIGGVPGEARFDNNAATYPVLLQLAPT